MISADWVGQSSKSNEVRDDSCGIKWSRGARVHSRVASAEELWWGTPLLFTRNHVYSSLQLPFLRLLHRSRALTIHYPLQPFLAQICEPEYLAWPNNTRTRGACYDYQCSFCVRQNRLPIVSLRYLAKCKDVVELLIYYRSHGEKEKNCCNAIIAK